MTQKEIKMKVPGHSDRNMTMQFEDISYDVKTKGNIFKLSLDIPAPTEINEDKQTEIPEDMLEAFDGITEHFSRSVGMSISESAEEDESENLKRCHAKAKAVSEKEKCVQHINKRSSAPDKYGHKPVGAGKHYVSDWYDSDETVASYNNGRLREAVELANELVEETEKLADLTKINTKTLQSIHALHRHFGENGDVRSAKSANRIADELKKRGDNVPRVDVKEAAEFETSITSRGTGAKQKQFTGARIVKGKGYGEHGKINTPASKTITKSFSFPELKGVFAQNIPQFDGKATEVKGRAMVDDEEDASVAKPAPQVSNDEAERIHAQLHGASRAVLGINHIRAALAKGMEGGTIITMSRSPVGRKQLRSLSESFSDAWVINVHKEGNLYRYEILDGEDVIAEGVNITIHGASKLAYEKAEALEEQITEQAIVMLENKEFEEGKLSRVLDIAKSVAK